MPKPLPRTSLSPRIAITFVTSFPHQIKDYGGGFPNSRLRVADSQDLQPSILHSQQTLVQASVLPDSKYGYTDIAKGSYAEGRRLSTSTWLFGSLNLS